MNKTLFCGEMAQSETKYFNLFGAIAGEMDVGEIPIAKGVDVEALKKGDDDPLEVVVEIPASKSKRGWNYTANSLKNIVDVVNKDTLNGFLGHQKPEDVSNQFLPPVTHWVGAKMVGEIAYFRGIVDAAAKDLKRWIRSGRIRQVSIFGMPKLETISGETHVVAYKPMSIDWTPLDRAGMSTRIVAIAGEMWDSDGNGPDDKRGKDDDSGDKADKDNQGGDEKMTPEELLELLVEMYGNKQITMKMIYEALEKDVEELAGEMDSSFIDAISTNKTVLESIKKELGITGEMDVVEVVKEAAKAMATVKENDFQKVVGEMMETKVTSDAIREDLLDSKTAIGKLWDYHSKGITSDMTEEQIAGEMDKFLESDAVKGVINSYHTDNPAGVGSNDNRNQGGSNLVSKRSSI